jgi:serine/threonine protein kinase
MATLVEHGSFGAVVRTPNGTVKKLFLNNAVRQKALENSNEITRILGNNYRMRETELGNTNYPTNITNVRKNVLRNRLTRKTGLFGVTMKNFGINLEEYVDVLRSEYITEEFVEKNKWTVAILLREVQKLIHHICIFYDNLSCHGDIRMSNIMIAPASHTLRLIDFDYYGTFQKVSNAYMGENALLPRDPLFPCVPPEYLVFRGYTDSPKYDINKLYDLYANMQLDSFPSYYTVTFKIMHNNNNNQSTRKPPPSELISKIKDALKNPVLSEIIQLKNTNNDTFTGVTACFIDVFGLGMALLELTIMLYPDAKDSNSDDTDIRTIKHLVELLEKMASFNIDKRLDPPTAKSEIDALLESYQSRQGGKRRTRKHRKQRTRRASKN